MTVIDHWPIHDLPGVLPLLCVVVLKDILVDDAALEIGPVLSGFPASLLPLKRNPLPLRRR